MPVRPRRPLLTVLLVFLVGLGVVPATTADAAVPLLRVTGSNTAFSPNGDRVKDLGLVGYTLDRRAWITARVTTPTGRLVLARGQGRMAAGRHLFAWDGRTSAGRLAADGRYVVTVVARRTRHGAAHRGTATLVLASRPTVQNGEVHLSSSTVYPHTTVITDEVVGNFYRPQDARTGKPVYGVDQIPSVRVEVLDARGRLVDTLPIAVPPVGSAGPCFSDCGRFTWDGRTSIGAIAPDDTYRVRLVRGRDAAGNIRVQAPLVVVEVSSTRLVARTQQVSLPASQISRPDYSGGCNGCTEYAGQVGSSSRFPGGLTFASVCGSQVPADQCRANRAFELPLSGRRTPSDRMTVVAHGGPTAAGRPDTGGLYAGGGSAPMAGDTTATIADVPLVFDTEVPWRPRYTGPDHIDTGLDWSFAVPSGQSYDIASFDVSWTTYVPAS